MYWAARCRSQGNLLFGRVMVGIASSGMDGSDLKPVLENLDVRALTVDQNSASVYWIATCCEANFYSEKPKIQMARIYKGDLQSDRLRGLRVMQMDYPLVLGLTVADTWLYWWDTPDLSLTQMRLFRCNKSSANHMSLHEVHIEQSRTPDVDRLFLFLPHSHPPKPKGPCTSLLCSHICAPSPTGYMRCLCPAGFSLMLNGWSCGK